MTPGRWCRLCLVLLLWPAVRVHAQAAGVGTGRLDTLVVATADSSQRYALYLPSAYDATRRWPLLLVLDPRGRAREALELFRPAAERLGYVVMSAYGSRSDTSDADVNLRAANAMLESAQDRLRVDLRRLYFAGLSGTARDAIRFALELRGQVAGVIGVGAGASGAAVAQVFGGDSSFAYFGVTGTDDFNHDEVRALAHALDSARVPTRLAVFAGPHGWPPASVTDEALEWLTLRAMRAGRARPDTAWLAARLDAEVGRASQLEREGRLEAAARLFAAIGRDYAPSPRAAEATRHAAELEGREPLVRLRTRMRELARDEQQRDLDVRTALLWFRNLREPAPATEVATRLGIAALRRQATEGDSLDAPSARRMLARTEALVSFYEPRVYLAQGNAAKAARLLEVGATLAPLRGDACAVLAELRRRAPASVAPLVGQCR